MALVGTGAGRPVRPGNWRDVHLDLSAPSTIRELMERERPTAVFYCAYDKSDPTITVDGAVAAARASYTAGARFVLFSSDLVFDGRTGGYSEQSLSAQVSLYGEMKAEAEALVQAEHPGSLVIRTSLLVGESGTMLRPAYE